jgi:3-hydroxymyristoyl/3-hydroxydecanoyl-(acyl carrier protein) dehydratase
MLLEGEKILEMIPQRPPIVMVDKLISVEEGKTTTGLSVQPDNIFVMDGIFREPGIIENIAQSAALGVGYTYRNNNEEVPLGFIGAIKNLVINFLPEVYSELTTEVTVEYQVMEATLIRGCVFSEGNLVAECEMKIFLRK